MAVPNEPRLSSLQQERSRQTRKKLVSAANRLWRAKGFNETTVRDICAAAGVAKGTFYFYFPHKEDLLLELGYATAERAAEEVTSDPDTAETTEDLMHTVVTGIARRVGRTPVKLVEQSIIELSRSFDRVAQVRSTRQDLQTTFTAIFERGQERGEVATDHDAAELAAVLTAVILQGLLLWAQGDVAGRSLEAALWDRTLLVLRGAAHTTV